MPVELGLLTIAHTGVGLGVMVTVAVFVGTSVWVGVDVATTAVWVAGRGDGVKVADKTGSCDGL